MSVKRGRIVAVMIFLVAAAAVVAGCGGEKPTIKVHAWESDSHFLNNAVFEFIVEKGYGYPVEEVLETTPVLEEALPKGDVDLNLEGWHHNIFVWYNRNLKDGKIVNLGTTFTGGPQFFIIPRWMAEEYDIKTVFDMADHWQLFQDPQDPSKGVFYNCVVVWECAEINKVKLDAYGLTRYYNLVSPGNGPALEAALARPQEAGQPVFGYYWSPTDLMEDYEWHILEEPVYSDECWLEVIGATEDSALRPTAQACAYGDHPIEKIAHSGLLAKAPDVVDMLRKMNVGVEPINLTLAWVAENDVMDWEEAAIYHLRSHEDQWRDWVSPDAYSKIKRALEEIGG